LDKTDKAIWIDVDNSPHVPLFAPIIRHYRDNGVEVILTARDHSQTIELLQLNGFSGSFDIIGTHYGKSGLNKIRGLLVRGRQLVSHLKKVKKTGTDIKVAISHGSRSMVLAARWLRIPVITMYDYEFTETRIFNLFSDKVLIPKQIPDSTLDKIGLSVAKRVKYDGFKEELYIRHFEPASDFRASFFRQHALVNSDDTILAILRPPATTANYHAEQSDVLFQGLLGYLLAAERVCTVIVPRTSEQAAAIKRSIAALGLDGGRHLILEKAVDGLDLAHASDLVISGGGTMNREAALLGVPVYSFFNGKQGALDVEMEKSCQITFIRRAEDIEKIILKKRDADEASGDGILTRGVESCVRQQINSFLEN
jgi:predicted glycosyltransferase